MFSIQTDTFAGYVRYRLANEGTGESLCVLPGCGGLLQELNLSCGGLLHSVIDGVEEIDLPGNMWRKSALLFPFPGRVKDGAYTFEGRTYQLPINEPLRNTALHGLVADEPFVIIETACDENIARLEIGYDYGGRLEGYPFPFSLRVTYSLDAKGVFCLHVTAQNTGRTAMPMGFGWHPYFKTGSLVNQLRLCLPAHAFFELDETLVPTGETKRLEGFTPEDFAQGGAAIGVTALDHGFAVETGDKHAVTLLRDDTRNLTISIRQQPNEGLRYVQVYTPPHRGSIAIEPQTCMGNAFNNGLGLMTLQPGEIWQGEIRVEVRSQRLENSRQ
ncbi:MAG: aldose 1-epimerase [Cytophagales bacterium]|nr:aldose 1-epimerase [Cytophagales bacterium]